MKPYLIFLSCITVLAACTQPEPKKVVVVHKKVVKKIVIAKDIAPKTPDTISVAAVGDMMLGTSYPTNYTLPPDSARNSFATVIPELKNNDIVFGNLEGTLLDGGKPSAYKKKLETAYLFRMPTGYGQVFKDAGFNLISLANNHITDFGDDGVNSTMHTLDSLGIHYAGLESRPDTVFTIKGIRYGFCAFAPNAHTVPILLLDNAAKIISALKQRADVVIVSFHGGAEGAQYEHVPRAMESYIHEKRGDVYAFAHNAIDAGADLVLGNGPHVSRAMELYKGRLIAYSLGNFCTYKSVSVAGVCGLAPLLKVKLNKKGEFLNGRLVAFRQTHAEGLIRDTTNKVIARIKALTDADFPESGLVIGEDGIVTVSPVAP